MISLYQCRREHIPKVISLVEEAIEEGCFKYQFHVTDKKYAPRVFSNLLMPSFSQSNIIVATFEGEVIGFSAFKESEFCNNFFVDGILTYVKEGFRGTGVSVRLRHKSLDSIDLVGKIVRYSVEEGNYAGEGSAKNFVDTSGLEVKKTGTCYEVRLC